MKRISTLILICLTLVAYSQSQRMVLLEHYTQASCGPCAGFNPPQEILINNNYDDIASFKIQTSWPGFDPMYNHNPSESDSRVGYYNVTGVPNPVLNGVSANWGQADFDAVAATPSAFDVVLTQEVSSDYSTLTLTMDITATMAVTTATDMRAHMVAVEKFIPFASAPGSNGETEFHDVMKKFLPDVNGTDIPETWAVGDTYQVVETWDIANVYNIGELRAVAFIQDNGNKEVHQAAKTEPNAPLPFTNNAAAAQGGPAADFGITSACGDVTPTVKITNFGNANLTSLDIAYQVNADAPQTFAWTGDLNPWASENVVLPTTAFNAVSGPNNITFNTSNPNGVADDDTNNDELIVDFDVKESDIDVTVEIITDDYGHETYWEIQNGAGVAVASGGNTNVGLAGGGAQTAAAGQPGAYGNNVTETIPLTLAADDCYKIVVVDDWGDGICCAYGNGSFKVTDVNGVQISNIGEFSASTNDNFTTSQLSVGIESLNDQLGIAIFPNPASQDLNIDLKDRTTAINIEIFNAAGQTLALESNHNGNLFTYDVSTLATGVYFVQISDGTETVTEKITIAR